MSFAVVPGCVRSGRGSTTCRLHHSSVHVVSGGFRGTPGFERATVVARHDHAELLRPAAPVGQQRCGHRRLGLHGIAHQDVAQPLRGLAVQRLDVHHLAVHAMPGQVEHVTDAAGHARGDVAPGRAEDHRSAAGHVLQRVVAHPRAPGRRAGVAPAEPLADPPAEEDLATGGEIFLRGRGGERFCGRNSGAPAGGAGVGDHALEYMTGGRAVILGSAGRNIAAGMSGGVGYVLDLARHRVNSEMVDVEDLDGEASQWLRDVLERYRAATESTGAGSLLADWGRWAERFSVIMPRDYRRAMEAKRAAEAAGYDVDLAVMEAARGGAALRHRRSHAGRAGGGCTWLTPLDS